MSEQRINKLNNSPLGQKSAYISEYDPSLIFPIERSTNRSTIGIQTNELPFKGFDIWNSYEMSWLNIKGKPIIATCRFIIPCNSEYIIESKSFKLYLNSFNQTKFNSHEDVKSLLQHDLSKGASAKVVVQLYNEKDILGMKLECPKGICIDNIDSDFEQYSVNSDFLSSVNDDNIIEETVYSNLLKTNCPVTGQPDWGSVEITYKGVKIDYEGLLKYIVSFRNHNDFHEHCTERIFCDIMNVLKPLELTVCARYTRRGGLDINPYRSTKNLSIPEIKRLFRQ